MHMDAKCNVVEDGNLIRPTFNKRLRIHVVVQPDIPSQRNVLFTVS